METRSTPRGCRLETRYTDGGLETRPVRRDDAPPLALTRMHGSALFVAHACPRALAAGVRSGMTLAQAAAIAPGLRTLHDAPSLDRDFLLRLAAWAVRFTPLVQPVEPDVLLLNIAGCAKLFGGEKRLARLALRDLAGMNVHAHAAIADTVGGAWALATSGGDDCVVVPPGQTVARIAALPPVALRIDPCDAERLGSVGVRTIADLLSLPRSSLQTRFGRGLVRRLAQALGEVAEPISPLAFQPPASADWTFDGPLRDLAGLQSAARRLLARVFAELDRRQETLRRFDVLIHFEPPLDWECSIDDAARRRRTRTPAHLPIALARPSRSEKHLGQLLARRLESVDLSAGVRGLRISAVQTSRWMAVTPGLFDDAPPADAETLAELLDRITNRLGHAAVLRPVLVDDHQPEKAFSHLPVADAGFESSLSDAAPHGPTPTNPERLAACLAAAPRCVNPRPLRLLDPPSLIRAVSIIPGGRPVRMVWRGREHQLTHVHGPERIETAWWRGPDVRRDYFHVTSHTGEQFWIFLNLDERRWYLHGLFV